MQQTYYRICSKCGNQNSNDANFCLKCGAPLSITDEYTVVSHAADLNFPLFDLDLSPDEVSKTKGFIISSSDEVPAGYHTVGLIFSESDIPNHSEMKATWEDLMKHLYGLLLTRNYSGAIRIRINPEPTNPGQLCLYGEAIVKDRVN